MNISVPLGFTLLHMVHVQLSGGVLISCHRTQLLCRSSPSQSQRSFFQSSHNLVLYGFRDTRRGHHTYKLCVYCSVSLLTLIYPGEQQLSQLKATKKNNIKKKSIALLEPTKARTIQQLGEGKIALFPCKSGREGGRKHNSEQNPITLSAPSSLSLSISRKLIMLLPRGHLLIRDQSSAG